MTTYSSVACSEEFNSLQENYDYLNGGEASVVLRCAWGDRQALIADMLDTPQTHPYDSTLVAVNCASRPDVTKYTSNGQGNDYIDALVTVRYSSTVFDVASEDLEPTLDYQTLDYNRFRWPSGVPLTEGEAPPFLIMGMNLVRTRYRMPSIPAEALTNINHCNDTGYVSLLLGLTFPAETLLFQPGGYNRSFSTLGSLGWTATAKFSYRPQGWNTFWNVNTQSYQFIYLKGSVSRYIQYPLGSFSSLLA